MTTRIKSVEELKKLQQTALDGLTLRTRGDAKDGRREVLVCVGGGCLASGALEICSSLKKAIADNGLESRVKVVETGCMGPCAAGPVAKVMPDNTFYQGISPEDAIEIVASHLKEGKVVAKLLHKDSVTGKPVAESDKISYFKSQTKIALARCGNIDPLNINEYIAVDGYQGLAKAIADMSPDDVVKNMIDSGLRGRGGGGFPTGLKWKFTKASAETPKSVVCNADEGDPGAFMDRSVLEGDPHSVIEGMAIAAFAVGASRGYVYCRAEYPIAIERLQNAIDQARETGLLGENIMGSGFSFDLEIRKGSGAFVCGEETALLASIEGQRGEPRPRPPFPAVKGLWNKPTLLNNVETFANVPAITLRGAEWYAKLGTEKSKGTKVFALAGAVNNTGLVEVPIGISLGELIYDIGGGIIDNKPFKAAQLGGPSGGCIPKAHLNVPLDYESLNELGAIMGSGGLIVMDEDACMVDVARFFLEFVQEESCGKCTPCRVGTKRLLEILPDTEMDTPLGLGSGAADIFANTGGVMEAALRTAYELVTGRELPFANLHVTPVVGLEGIKEASFKFENVLPDWKFLEGVTAKVAVAHTLKNARNLVDKVRKGEADYHFVEVMTCPGGCIGGGGQPRTTTDDVRRARMAAIYQEDEGKKLRKSHDNPDIKQIYADFLGQPLGKLSHDLLHTHYHKRDRN